MFNLIKSQGAIEEQTIGGAWLRLLAWTAATGEEVEDMQQGTILEVLSQQVEVRDASFPDPIVVSLGSEEMIKSMKNNFFALEPVPSWGFSYGERLFAFKGVNQVEWAVSRLKQDSNTKSATISLLDPTDKADHIPCVVSVDFKIRNNHLRVQSFFRSSDVLRKFYADAICVLALGQEMAKRLGIKGVDLAFSIASAHLYLKDGADACALLEKVRDQAHNQIAAADAVQRLHAVLRR